MKILVVGSYVTKIYEKALYDAFCKLGYDTYKFSWNKYFDKYFNYLSSFSFSWKNFREYPAKFLEAIKRAEHKYHIGPTVDKMNKGLIAYAKEVRPDLIFIQYGVFFSPSTIRALRAIGAMVFGYNNDDPFNNTAQKYFWRKYLSSCPEYDYMFSFRLKNIEDYKRVFGMNSEILRAYYIKDRNFHIDIPDERYKCDISFVGHYEDDGRDEFLIELVRGGYSFKLYGTEWHRSKYYEEFKKFMKGDIQPVREDYNLALNSCKIALSFLSHLNNDTYTRRTFEIPATGTFMLSTYTEDLATLFEPDKEAVYFKTSDEMISKVDYYLAHDDERKKIARNGYERLIRDGHEVTDRAKQIIRTYERIKRGK
ncbi:MAG: glycosyltransferase [Synergistaceae bacterium]|nr:glycosyltransferase [Synergistaceae bacterium]